ncbi:hypothetical protein ACI65C_011129 [Semiaphis heraclei]
MQPVKIKNINKSYMKKPFIVKGRVKYLNVEPNRNSSGSHLNAIVFDDSSEIEIVAFKNCENIAKLLKVNNVVTIENGILREVNKDYKKIKHKYQIILESISIIKIINNNEVDTGALPIHKYTSAAELNTLTTGMIIDVIGVCYQLNIEKTVNAQNQQIRKGQIIVDSTVLIDVRFSGDKVDTLYKVGSTLTLISAKFINFNGKRYLIVGDSSSVKYVSDFPVVFPDQRLSTSSITQPNKNSTIELPEQRLMSSSITQSYKISGNESIDQKPSTSYSTPSNKRKTQDFEGEEGSSKTEPKQESFSDERFVSTVFNLVKNINNDKNGEWCSTGEPHNKVLLLDDNGKEANERI